jgi:hypothetical protein
MERWRERERKGCRGKKRKTVPNRRKTERKTHGEVRSISPPPKTEMRGRRGSHTRRKEARHRERVRSVSEAPPRPSPPPSPARVPDHSHPERANHRGSCGERVANRPPRRRGGCHQERPRLRVCAFSRYSAVKTPADDSQCGPCTQSADTREWSDSAGSMVKNTS